MIAVTATGYLAAAAVIATSFSGSSSDGSGMDFGATRVPPDSRYQQVVTELLANRPAARIHALVVKGGDGAVRVVPARGGRDYPVTFLNRQGMALSARVLARTGGSYVVNEMQLARGSTGRLRWLLIGRRDGVAWKGVVSPRGTGLRTVR